MEINGLTIQNQLLEGLIIKIIKLKKAGITPGIAIITLGPEESWEAYVAQKLKLAKKLAINAKLINLNSKSTLEVITTIKKLNNDNSIHGLIVQRPFPSYIDTERVIQNISKDKDIDGFCDNSKFEVPVWLAVRLIITRASQLLNVPDFEFWLSNQAILIVGKGETAGKPIAESLKKLKIATCSLDSKTSNRNNLFEKADIVISATGRKDSVPVKLLKKNCILIGIGLHRMDGKLVGDFDENEAKNHVLFYTPSPGGVGPLNLFYLFENLVKAVYFSLEKQS